MNQDYITIPLVLRSPRGKNIRGTVVISEGKALFTCEDPFLAKQLYEKDKAQGKDVYYGEEHRAFIEVYENKTKEEITEIIKKEIVKAGGQFNARLR